MHPSKTLLGDEAARNLSANEAWKRREVDRMLELYLSGATPARIATELRRNRKAVVRKLQEYIYNERDRSKNYRPKLRTSRKGKRLTENDTQIITECRKKGVSWEQIAKILARPVAEIDTDASNKKMMEVAAVRQLQIAQLAPTVDVILAHRYLYHVYKEPIITDAAYDQLVEEEMTYGAGGFSLSQFSDPTKMPGFIRDLALYFLGKYKAVNNIPSHVRLSALTSKRESIE